VDQKENFKGAYQKLKFLNKFYLYNGLHKYSDNDELVKKPLDQFEQEVMQMFDCNPEWPICLYDFTYKNRIPEYLAFRVREAPKIINDYFGGNGHTGLLESSPGTED